VHHGSHQQALLLQKKAEELTVALPTATQRQHGGSIRNTMQVPATQQPSLQHSLQHDGKGASAAMLRADAPPLAVGAAYVAADDESLGAYLDTLERRYGAVCCSVLQCDVV